MLGANKDFAIADIIKHLKFRRDAGTPTALVLGARTGGLYRSDYLYDTLMQFSNRDFKLLSKSAQFAECYRTLIRQFSAGEINSILKNGLKDIRMSDADIYLASLIQLGLFDLVVTTNIDTLLEKALEHVGMKEMYDFAIYSAPGEEGKEKAIPTMSRIPCQVIKVFGQLSNDDYTIDRANYWSKRPLFEKQLKTILSRDIMAIGLDPCWDAEFYRVFPLQGERSFWFINEDMPEADNAAMDALRWNSNTSYLVGEEEGNYNYCIYTLYREFIGSLPVTLVSTGLILGELRRLRDEVRKLQEELRRDRPSS